MTRFVFVLLLIACAGCAGCASTPDVWPPYDLVPVDPAGQPLADPTVTLTRPQIEVVVEALDDQARADWLQARTGATDDPFARPGLSGQLLTVRLELRISGEEQIHFQPQDARIYRGQGRSPVLPLDYTRVFEMLGSRAGEPTDVADDTVRQVMRGLWDSARSVPAGDAVEGLLIFPAPRELTPPLVLELMLVRGSTRVERLRVPFSPVVRGTESPPPV